MARQFHIAPATVNAFRRALPRWYRRHKRDLPWRRTRDPYAIWVSEIMLQQTRVETVIPYYARWMRVFPTVAALARAPASRVLKLWEGLGYYSRARNLRRAAQMVVGRVAPLARPRGFRTSRRLVPTTAVDLRRLPGVGRYTAGAIASIAFDECAALVDGNVARVFARVFNIRANVKLPATRRRLWKLAEALLPARGCGEFNQALMELGALVCLPANPRCEGCPLRRVCRAPGDALPNRGPKQRIHRVTEDVMLAQRDGKVLLRRRPASGLLAGMWELPPYDGRSGRLVLTVRHAVTNRRITLRVWKCRLRKPPRGCCWMSPRSLTMPSAHRRALALAH